jgi:hypothetical protein
MRWRRARARLTRMMRWRSSGCVELEGMEVSGWGERNNLGEEGGVKVDRLLYWR